MSPAPSGWILTAHRPLEEITVEDEQGCWIWQRYRDKNGYGRAYDGGSMDWAHRVIYRLHVGPIPEKYSIDHLCGRGASGCVRPDHLEAVTQAENLRRYFERGGYVQRRRQAAMLRRDGMSYADIAKALGLSGRHHAHSVVMSAIRLGHVDADELPKTYLTAEDYEEIRELHALGVSQRELSKFYRVDNSNISRIINGRRGKPDGSA